MDAYGLQPEARRALPQMMVKRLSALVSYIKAQAESGNQDFAKNIEDGHLQVYRSDIAYISVHEAAIRRGISGALVRPDFRGETRL